MNALYVIIYGLLSLVTGLIIHMFMIEYRDIKGYWWQLIVASLLWPLLWVYVIGTKLLYSK